MSSSVYTTAARVRTAIGYMNDELFVAWGQGNPSWGSQQEVTAQFAANGQFNLGHPRVKDVGVASASHAAFYTLDVDFIFNPNTGIVTRMPAGNIPAEEELVFAFTVEPDAASPAVTALLDEVGRKRVLTKHFVTPSDEGTIQVETGKFAISATPTKHIAVEVTFLPEEAPTAIIRELGLFADTEVQEGLPPGQQYFTPSEVVSPGTLIRLTNRENIIRNATARETFFLVLSL
jgi:hypothetical protein